MINQVSITQLVAFRKLSERSQATYAKNLKIPKKPKSEDDEDGRNYWQRGISGVSTAFKNNDNTIVKQRIELLLSVYETNDNRLTRLMYQRNLDILNKYDDYDFSLLYPPYDVKFIKKTKEPLTLKDIPFRVEPQHVICYGNKDNLSVGAIYFVTVVGGYNINELGIFAEATYRYLSEQHGERYNIDPNYCLTIDPSTMRMATYQQVLSGEISSLFDDTVKKLKGFL